MSQISLTKFPMPDDKTFVGSEAKNPLPQSSKRSFAISDFAGLSWIILDDPFDLRNYA